MGQGAAATVRLGAPSVVRRAFVIRGAAVVVLVVAGAWWWLLSATAADGGARAWNTAEVQRWFEEHEDGKWLEYAGKFKRLNGEEMSGLSEERFVGACGDVIGSAIYHAWRATCCAWVDALWSPGGVALVLVGTATVMWTLWWLIQREPLPAEFVALPAEFVAFADALRGQKRRRLTARDVVDFGTPTLDDLHVVEGPIKIYVRECYVPLVEEYFNDDVKPTMRRVIIGSPGIGKSVLRLFVACKALDEGLDVAFVKFDGTNHPTYIVSADGTSDRTLDSHRLLYRDIHADSMVVIADVENGNLELVPGIHSPRCWYFTSPNSKISRDAFKRGFTFLWIPLWTLAELQEAARLLNLSLTHTNEHLLPDPAVEALYAGDADGADRARIVEMRCYQFGGVARVVLAENEDIILSHLESVEDALFSVVENGRDADVRNLFHNRRFKLKGTHTLVGVRTTFGVGPERRRWFDYSREFVLDVAAYPDASGEEFLQLPVDWLSRPLRELAFQHLVRRHDMANRALPFGSWPAGVQGICHERFTFNRIVLAAQARAAVFEKLHRIKSKRSAAARWQPRDLSDEVRDGGVSGFFITRRYVDLPDGGGYNTMTGTLSGAIAESRRDGTHALLIPLADHCPAFDGVLILGGDEVEVLFVQVTLQRSHGIGAANTGARDFFEAALQAVRDSDDATRVAIVYVLRSPEQYGAFQQQKQSGRLASRVAQYKALPTVVAADLLE